MSYILEALKKSEQERERERGTLPDIKSVHAPSSSLQTEGRSWWPFILIGMLVLLGAVSAVVYIKFKPLASSDVAQTAQVEKQLAVDDNAADSEPVAPVESKPVTTVAKSTSAEKQEEKAVSAEEQKPPKVVFSREQLQHDDVIGNIEEQKKQRAEKESTSSAKGSSVSEKDAAIPISEIPDNIRKKIPRIAFEGHIYSSIPKRRSVMINGHKMREGDAVGDDLLLKEITVDGAEFEYQGYRFRLNALQDWSFN